MAYCVKTIKDFALNFSFSDFTIDWNFLGLLNPCKNPMNPLVIFAKTGIEFEKLNPTLT